MGERAPARQPWRSRRGEASSGPNVGRRISVRTARRLLPALQQRPEGGAEVVFGSGAVEARRPGLAVDDEHVVAFPIPVVALALEAVDIEIAADEDARALGFEDQIVVLVRQVWLSRPDVLYVLAV